MAKIKDLWNKIIVFFRNKENQETQKTTPVEAVELENGDTKDRQQRLESLNTSISGFFLKNNFEMAIDENTLITNLNKTLDDSTNQYENLGHFDGFHGTKDFDIHLRAEAHATHIQETVLSALQSKVNGLEQAIKSKIEQKERLLEKLRLNDVFHNEMLTYANQNNKEFSRSRKLMYIIFGCILLLSDIPLSMNIVGALGLVKMPDDSSVGDNYLGEDTETPNKIGIFHHVMDWISWHWESILFALGIAFSTILIKILYDEYIHTKLGKWTKDLYSFPDDQRTYVVIERYIKLGVNMIILIGLFVMLYNLGEVRNEAVTLKSMLRDEQTELSPSELSIKNIRFWSFVLVTLVIPTISGICLSIGFTIDDNIKSFSRSETQLKDAEENLDKSIKDHTELVMKKSQLEVFLEEWKKKEAKVKNIVKRFVSSYNQGFKRGYSIEHGYDFFKIVEKFHIEVVDKKFQGNLNN